MSPPDHFEVCYSINPWMNTEVRVSPEKASRQWLTLKQALQDGGAAIEEVPPVPGLPDLVFTANAAFVRDGRALLARFRNPERQPEEDHDARSLERLGYEVLRPPAHTSFEGAGDALVYDDRLILAGYRQRTDVEAHGLLSSRFGLPLLSLELPDPSFYHVDTCLCPLPGGHLLYYPGAFDDYGLRVLHANVPEAKRLEVTRSEAAAFACNAVWVGRRVYGNQFSSRLQAALKHRGFEPVALDLSEFIKAGGSAKCLTLRME